MEKKHLLKYLSRPWLIFLAIVIIYLGVNIIKSYYRTRSLLLRLNTTREEMARQQMINQKTSEKLVKLEDDRELEKIAREKLGLVREGEVVYKIIPTDIQPKKGGADF